MDVMPAHPGKILFYEDDTLVNEAEVAEVPEAGRFARDERGEWQPVVKVVMRNAGKQRYVREYGPAGQLLRATVAR
jgi:hypothetical protein